MAPGWSPNLLSATEDIPGKWTSSYSNSLFASEERARFWKSEQRRLFSSRTLYGNTGILRMVIHISVSISTCGSYICDMVLSFWGEFIGMILMYRISRYESLFYSGYYLTSSILLFLVCARVCVQCGRAMERFCYGNLCGLK